MKRIVLGLALACSALATPALAVSASDIDHPSVTTAVAKAYGAPLSNNNIDQAAIGANVDHRRAAASLDTTASYVFGNDFASVAPVQLLDQASFDFVPAAPMPMMRYAVLVRVSINNPFGADLDPATWAKQIV